MTQPFKSSRHTVVGKKGPVKERTMRNFYKLQVKNTLAVFNLTQSNRCGTRTIIKAIEEVWVYSSIDFKRSSKTPKYSTSMIQEEREK